VVLPGDLPAPASAYLRAVLDADLRLLSIAERLRQHWTAHAAARGLTGAQVKVLLALAPGEAVPMRELRQKFLELPQQRALRQPVLTGLVPPAELGGTPENQISFPLDKQSLPIPKHSGTSISTDPGFAQSLLLRILRQTKPP